MIAIIGAGQLGSRHLQSLALLDREVPVQVVDPNPASLESAKRRLAEIPEGARLRRVEYLTDLNSLAPELDLAIVATLSDVRERVVTELLSTRRARKLILEKVLFQDPASYGRIGALLSEKGAKAWVNCPRRLWPHVRALRDRVRGARRLEISVDGTNWGLASNAVHFLDLAAFLSGRSDFKIVAGGLDATVLSSKRPGFVELTGTLTAALPGLGGLTLNARAGDALFYEIRVFADGAEWVIRELENKARVRGGADAAWREESFPRPLVSRSAHAAVQSLLDDGDCGLTPYPESAALHLPLIEALTAHLARLGRAGCPIT